MEGVPVLKENGDVNYLPAAFIFLFIIIVNWTLLQVCICVIVPYCAAACFRVCSLEFVSVLIFMSLPVSLLAFRYFPVPVAVPVVAFLVLLLSASL